MEELGIQNRLSGKKTLDTLLAKGTTNMVKLIKEYLQCVYVWNMTQESQLPGNNAMGLRHPQKGLGML